MFQYSKKREKGRSLRPLLLLVLLALSAIALYFILREEDGFAHAVITGFSEPVRNFLGGLCSWVPISLTEIAVVLFFLWIVVHFIRTLALVIKSHRKLFTFGRRSLIFVAVLAYLFTAYCYLWSICYFHSPLTASGSFDQSDITAEDLADTASYFARRAGELAPQVPRDSDGHFSVEVGEILRESTDIYENFFSDFGFLSGKLYAPKAMLSSPFLSRTGFTGVYFPLTGEANVNVYSPRCLLPYTVAHELAHMRGVASEDEACFVGIAACVASDNVIYAYSGYLDGLIFLMNDLYKADRDAYSAIRATYTDEMLVDLADNNSFWNSQESTVTVLASAVYDGYLKSNGQEDGLLSYGECVNLLVAYYRAS